MRFLSSLIIASLAIAGSKAVSTKELVSNMKIGWSLGNTLDANCSGDLDYSLDQTASETCWGNPKTTPELFEKLSSEGFNVFRIPTTWDGHFEGDYKISADWMNRVHEIVDYAHSTGSYVILNIHHEKWNYAFANNLSKAESILEKVWTQISEEFKDYDEKLIFEGLNEPRKVGDAVEWTGGDQEGWNFVNEMNALFVKTVRASGGMNAKRHLMIPTYAACVNENAMKAFKMPNDSNLIVSLHAYVPYNFALNNGEGAVTTFDSTNDIDYTFRIINEIFRSKDIPVIMGEFGAMNRNNEEDRAKWANYYIKTAKSIGVPCVLWDNGVFEGEGERFAVIDRNSLKVTYPLLLNGLMTGLTGGSPSVVVPTTSTTAAAGTTSEPTTSPSTNGYCSGCTVTATGGDGSLWGWENSKSCRIDASKCSTGGGSSSAVNPDTEDYTSCASNDWDCKSKMASKCNKNVADCWSKPYSSELAAKCVAMGNECQKNLELKKIK